MKKKLTQLSLCCLALALILFALSYGMFHYLTDSGFTAVWHPEAGKPFVTEMVADLAVLFLFGSGMSFLVSRIFFPDK